MRLKRSRRPGLHPPAPASSAVLSTAGRERPSARSPGCGRRQRGKLTIGVIGMPGRMGFVGGDNGCHCVTGSAHHSRRSAPPWGEHAHVPSLASRGSRNGWVSRAPCCEAATETGRYEGEGEGGLHERPTRYEYRLTPRRLDLYPVLMAIMHRDDIHMAKGGRHPCCADTSRVGLFDPIMACPSRAAPLDAREVTVEPDCEATKQR